LVHLLIGHHAVSTYVRLPATHFCSEEVTLLFSVGSENEGACWKD
jgi:hypothetical protein